MHNTRTTHTYIGRVRHQHRIGPRQPLALQSMGQRLICCLIVILSVVGGSCFPSQLGWGCQQASVFIQKPQHPKSNTTQHNNHL